MKKNCGSGGSNKSKTRQQDLRVFWKLMNPKDCAWQNHYQIIMKILMQEKETIHYSITIWYTFILMPQAVKFPAAKSSGGQGMGQS